MLFGKWEKKKLRITPSGLVLFRDKESVEGVHLICLVGFGLGWFACLYAGKTFILVMPSSS
jgi:hypothetical protein